MAVIVCSVERDTVAELPTDHCNALQRLWSDIGVQTCFDRRREFQISDSAK